MTYRNDGSYMRFSRTESKKYTLGSAGRFIDFVRRQDRESKHLQDEPAVTPTQNAFHAVEMDK